MPQRPRKPIRLPRPFYLGRRVYFTTICTSERKKLFATPQIVDPLIALLPELCRQHHFDLYAFCFMPDHCHFLLLGNNPDSELSTLLRYFKGRASALLRNSGHQNIRQKGFYDHILRTGDAQSAATAYIFENPIRAGLAKDIYAYPFTGSLVFDWRKFQIPTSRFSPPWKSAPK